MIADRQPLIKIQIQFRKAAIFVPRFEPFPQCDGRIEAMIRSREKERKK